MVKSKHGNVSYLPPITVVALPAPHCRSAPPVVADEPLSAGRMMPNKEMMVTRDERFGSVPSLQEPFSQHYSTGEE
jgi:hypothetical protein